MLGFGPISGFPISSLAALEFYIRGASTVLVSFVSSGLGKLDIFGSSVNILDISTSSVGFVKISRRKKQIIAEAVRHSMYNRSTSGSILASETQNSIHATNQSKKIRV